LCRHRTHNPPQNAAAAARGSFVRWATGVAFQQAKGQLEVGQARNRVGRTVERTVTCGFHCLISCVRPLLLVGIEGVELRRWRSVSLVGSPLSAYRVSVRVYAPLLHRLDIPTAVWSND
jgi:hypothetical protein